MSGQSDLKLFSEMPVMQAILKNAIPSTLAMLLVLIYNLADIFFVGRTHDPLQVAAMSLTSQVFVIYTALGTIFGVGGVSVISRAFGQAKHDYAKSVSSFCVWSSLCTGMIFSLLVWIFMDSILNMLGADDQTWQFAESYLSIVSVAGASVVFNGCCSNLLRAEGQPIKAMAGQLIGNTVNIILCPILILGLNLNTKGAALATVSGNFVASAYYIIYFLKGKSNLSLSIKRFTLGKQIFSRVMSIGVPASMNTILMCVAYMVLNRMVVSYGNLQLAGIGVATNVLKIPGLFCIGMGQGIQPLVGYCVGAGLWKRCKEIIKKSLLTGFSLSVILTGLIYLFMDQIVYAFLPESNAFQYGESYTRIMLGGSFLFGIFYVLVNVLQGFGAARESLIISISRQGIIYIPVLFIMRSLWGLNGLVWAQPIADTLATILVTILFLYCWRRQESVSGNKL